MKKYYEDFLDWCFFRRTPNFLLPLFSSLFIILFITILFAWEETYLIYKPTGTRVVKQFTDSQEYSLGLQKVIWYNESEKSVCCFHAKQQDLVRVPVSQLNDEKVYEELRKKLGK